MSSTDYVDPLLIGQVASTTANSGSAITLVLNQLNVVTLNAATPVITLPAGGVGYRIMLVLAQDATGGRVPSFTSITTIKWFPNNITPALTQTASKRDSMMFINDGTYWLSYVTGLNV